MLGLSEGGAKRVSVVIPALNAATTLRACVERLAGAAEIVVVDGGSSDGTPALAAQVSAKVVEAPRGRGVQLRAGAEAATGDWLLFLHADTLLESGWMKAVREHIAAFPDHAACFRFRLDDHAWQARVIECGVSLRADGLGLPYGDQGLLISRRHYDAVGGYHPLPLMEDVDLVRRIGLRHLRQINVAATTSAARWRRDGWWRRSARNLLCLTLYGAGVSPKRIARLYG